MHKLWFRDVKIEPLNVKCMFIIWRRSMLFRRRPYIVIRELKQINTTATATRTAEKQQI